MDAAALNPVALYVHLFGSALFCLVFLYLRRESGILYLGYWGLAWALETAGMLSAVCYSLSRAAGWLYPWAFFEFAFALALVSAAQAETRPEVVQPRSRFRLLLGFPLFLVLVYALGIQSSFSGYRALHSLVLAGFYACTYWLAPSMDGIGRRLFRIILLLLSVASVHHAAAYFYMHVSGNVPLWAPYVQYLGLFDFGLQSVLAFAAMSMWIGHLNHRVRSLSDELSRVQKEKSRSLELDDLSGVLNHAALSKRMERNEGFVGTVAVCDLDNFKQVNDRYGHLVGDEVLRNIGHLLRSSIRQQDEAFRWGGDEFVIVFYDENLPMVQSRMQQVEERLRLFQVRGYGLLPISLSWGAAEAAGRGLRETLDAADQQMYTSKRARR